MPRLLPPQPGELTVYEMVGSSLTLPIVLMISFALPLFGYAVLIRQRPGKEVAARGAAARGERDASKHPQALNLNLGGPVFIVGEWE